MQSFHNELSHNYGERIHIANSRLVSDMLARLCSPGTVQPQFNFLVRALFQHLLFWVLEKEVNSSLHNLPTRMSFEHPKQLLQAWQLDRSQRFVTVAIARAGIVPSEEIYGWLNLLFEPALVRQDHLVASRLTGPQGQVTGTQISYSKIGGDIENAIVVLPDPMGATGHTLSEIITLYKEQVQGKPTKFIAMNLIVTPEYLRTLVSVHPDVVVYGLRLDRGLSTPDVLALTPGEKWSEEKGLNDKQYIVPGAGGVGELMNNAFV